MAKPMKIKTSEGTWVDVASSTTDLSQYPNMTTTPISGFRNILINGDFRVWQRGTSGTHSGGGIYVDRWREYTDTGSGTQSKDTTIGVPGVASQSYKFTAGGSATNFSLWQIIESANCSYLAGQVVTFSFYASVSSARNLTVTFSSSTTTDAAWTGSWSTFSSTVISVGTSMARHTVTVTVPSTMKTMNVGISSGSPNLSAGSSVNITGAQLEVGSIATPFERRPIDVETRLCQRYYQVLKSGAFNSPAVHRVRVDQNSYDGVLAYYVEPRSGNPTYSVNSPSNIIHKPGVRWDTISSLSLTRMGTYVNINCYPTVDDGGNQSGMYLYGIDIIHDCEL